MSSIVAFKVKDIDTKTLFSCLVGWVDSSTEEIKNKNAQTLNTALSCDCGWGLQARLYLYTQIEDNNPCYTEKDLKRPETMRNSKNVG